ncbi:hypothetical protein DCW30_07245 [Streptomyces alfalfae]|nr:hypothetical protein D3X13_23555 [Streptomyces fradiae]RXX46033.1 hypothetical protein DCW30_07245 [Streptomyces alfalfae]RZM92026.1 hypothetical protein D4104_22055 [Streptomyces alfalfae]
MMDRSLAEPRSVRGPVSVCGTRGGERCKRCHTPLPPPSAHSVPYPMGRPSGARMPLFHQSWWQVVTAA